MARVYATAEQYEEYTGGPAPADVDYRLGRASRFLDAQVFRMCRYDVTDTGLPSHPLVAEAFAAAVCAQAEWGVEVGDITGAFMAGVGNAGIGSVNLARSVTKVDGSDAPGRQVAPSVGDALRSPDLTPDIFQLGAVTTL